MQETSTISVDETLLELEEPMSSGRGKLQLRWRWKEKRDSGYLRLKNVEIGYTLPSAWASKLRCSSLRIYATGVNLFTISKFISDYWDPETGADAYPMQRQVFVGVNLTF